jgi:hypothetical protein
MDTMRYERDAEESRTIGRRNRQGQVRQMFLVAYYHQQGAFEGFCENAEITPAVGKNYLAAYDRLAAGGIVPAVLSGHPDDVIESVQTTVAFEMWSELYDATADGRFGYGTVDRDGIAEAAERLGLRGVTKAQDIAKNHRSMAAAIIGDARCRGTALDTLLTLATEDPEIRQMMQDRGMFVSVTPEPTDGGNAPRPEPISMWARKMIALADLGTSVRELVFEHDEVPAGMEDSLEAAIVNFTAARDVLRGRRAMNEVH